MKSGNPTFSKKRALLMLHGFTGSPYDYESFLSLSGAWDVQYFVRLPGHIGGKSASFNPDAEWGRFLQDLEYCITTAKQHEASIHVLAYSMGARLWLKAYLKKRWEITAMFLMGVNPGLEGGNEREARLQNDKQLAEKLRHEGTSIFVDHWIQQPLIRTQLPFISEESLESKKRLDAKALAWALENYSPGLLPALWDQLESLDRPTVLIAGEADTKFTAIHQRMLGMLRNGYAISVKDAGHAPHIENPHGLAKEIDAYLASAN